MAPKKKIKRNKKVVNKRTSIKQKSSSSNQKKSNDFFLTLTKVVSNILVKPFFLINLTINRVVVIVKNISLQLFNLIKQTFKLLLEAIVPLLFCETVDLVLIFADRFNL